MRHQLEFSLSLLIALMAADTRGAPATPNVIERGAHHRTWANVREIQTAKGVRLQTNAIVELGTGLHYQKDGQWLESKEEIELVEGGAVARQGQMNVTFPPNINTGGIELTVNGKRFCEFFS